VNVRASQVGTIAPELAHRWSVQRRRDTAVKLLSRLRVAELITHVLPFDEAPAAYELIDRHPEQVIQVLLSYA
jgi:threonine dehydrogenase-like Zn-dependent dehydrogenase